MLLHELAAALHDSGLSHLLRGSLWLYPLVNIVHITGIALLFGGIVPLDLRLLGAFTHVPLAHLAGPLVRMATIGLLMALGSGLLLFATRPLDYVGEPLFGLKLLLLAAALANAAALRRAPAWREAVSPPPRDAEASATPTSAWRLAGLASIVLWLGVITAGRLIGYR